MLRRLPQGISLLRSRRTFYFLKSLLKFLHLTFPLLTGTFFFPIHVMVIFYQRVSQLSFPLAQSPTYVPIQMKHRTTNIVGKIHSIKAPPAIGPTPPI